jgi:hypothetical protein
MRQRFGAISSEPGCSAGTRPSDARSELDLERGLPTSPEDVAAQRLLRIRATITTVDFLRFMAALEPPTSVALRARRGPKGEPFRL